jgi:DNA-binding PadR family transcriptional regulator
MEDAAEALRERDFDVADERIGEARERTRMARELRDNLDEELITDGGLLTGGGDTHVTDLTQFQTLILATVADGGPDDGITYGLGIKDALEEYYGEEVLHGRLYPNLDDLVDRGLLTKGEHDRRTNQYALTDDGLDLLDDHIEWLAFQAGLQVVDGDHRLANAEPAVQGEGGSAGGVE